MALADDFYEGQRKSNRRIAEALAKEGMSSSPTSSHFVGANRVLQGLLGGLMQGRADAADKAQQDRISALLAGMPGLGEPSGGSVAASADLQDPATARAPDGMDRSITSGPRPPTAPPITMEPRPAGPSPYQLAGMAPINSQDTHHTPLDARMPREREQGLAALRAAMGGQPTAALPPMAGPTPPGAIPVQTEAIRPPAPPIAPPSAPATSPAASGIDPKMAGYIRTLLGSGDPRAEKFGMQLLTAEQQRMEARATRAAAEKPTFGKIGTAGGEDVMGWINPRTQTTTPAQVPGRQGGQPSGEIQAEIDRIVAAGGDPKTARTEMTKRAMGETLPAEAAGRLAMMDTAQKGMANTRKVLEGDWDATKTAQYYAAKAGVGAAAGEVGTAMRDIRLGVEAALRAMTGAAAPEGEVSRYTDLFVPTPWDDANSRKQKMDALNDFMDGARKNIQQGRALPGAAPPAAPPPAAPPATAAAKPTETRKIGGKTYVKINNQWFEQ